MKLSIIDVPSRTGTARVLTISDTTDTADYPMSTLGKTVLTPSTFWFVALRSRSFSEIRTALIQFGWTILPRSRLGQALVLKTLFIERTSDEVSLILMTTW